MSKISKELLEFKKSLEKDDLIITDILSLDGKTANGSEINTKNGKIKKINAMSAYSIKYNKTLATEFIKEKTNEIPTGPKLLKRIDISDMVITFDALNTQEKTNKYIKSHKGHYVALLRIIIKIFVMS